MAEDILPRVGDADDMRRMLLCWQALHGIPTAFLETACKTFPAGEMDEARYALLRGALSVWPK